MKRNGYFHSLSIIAVLGSMLFALPVSAGSAFQQVNSSPPDHVVKMIFIHHSTGENWLTDGYGNLGRVLGDNNYFVSDTNYGWGPDSIGDRTDIPNWTEWFRSENTPIYMDALFNESGQNSYYIRNLSDPGGENEIIMFKSCFPNSDLYGNPDDPAGDYEDMTVAGAKYVYNQILQYFATRPDKLFVVITAPPLSDRSNAENARAFNDWLADDWLAENGYAYNNVAVFDFYNVLTDKDAHHWFQDGEIKHIITNRDTLYYPSDDDHPSVAGSQKATDEFVPLLNIFYHRWQEGSAQLPPVEVPPVSSEDDQSSSSGRPVTDLGMVDTFESYIPIGTSGWVVYWDAATPTSLSCYRNSETVHSGDYAMQIDFDIAPNAWGTCSLFFDEVQDWSASEGLLLYLYAAEAGLIVDMDVYAGSPENQESYIYTIETSYDSTEGWVPVTLYWSDFHRVDWEEDAGAPFNRPDRILGITIGFSTYEDTPNIGTIWVDDLGFIGGVEPTEITGSEEPADITGSTDTDDAEDDVEGGSRRFCGSALLLPLLALLAWLLKFSRSG